MAEQNLERAPNPRPLIYGYTRVSSLDQQKEGFSLDEQEHRLREFAAANYPAHDFTLCVDPGESGGIRLAERKNGRKMVEALRAGDVVVGLKLDRMFRSAPDALAQTEDFLARKIDCIFLDIAPVPINDSAINRFFITMMSGMAEMELNRGHERRADAFAARRRRGAPLSSQPPMGKSIIGKGKDAKLIDNPRELETLALIYELNKAGHSNPAISRELTARGYLNRKGKPYHNNQIGKWIADEAKRTGEAVAMSRSGRIKTALAAKRATGWQPGNPRLGEARQRAAITHEARRAERYVRIRPILEGILATGAVNTLRGMVDILNLRKIAPLGKGQQWYPSTLRDAMRRLGLSFPDKPKPANSNAPERTKTGANSTGTTDSKPRSVLTQAQKRFRSKRKNDVLALYQDGITEVAEIARRLQIKHVQWVYTVLHDAKLPVGLHRASAKEAEIVAMVEQGSTKPEISAATGILPRSIYRLLARRRAKLAAAEGPLAAYADEIMPVIWNLQRAGFIFPKDIAEQLNQRGIPYRDSQEGERGPWTPDRVTRLLKRHRKQQPPRLAADKAIGYDTRLLAVIIKLHAEGCTTPGQIAQGLFRGGYRHPAGGSFWTAAMVDNFIKRIGWQIPAPVIPDAAAPELAQAASAPAPQSLKFLTSPAGQAEQIARWIATRCLCGPQYVTRSAELHDDYCNWAAEPGELSVSRRAFGQILDRDDNLARWRDQSGQRAFRGLTLRSASNPTIVKLRPDPITRAPAKPILVTRDPASLTPAPQLTSWIAERCTRGADRAARTRELYIDYCAWAARWEFYPLIRDNFIKELQKDSAIQRLCDPITGRTGGFRGLALRRNPATPAEPLPPAVF